MRYNNLEPFYLTFQYESFLSKRKASERFLLKRWEHTNPSLRTPNKVVMLGTPTHGSPLDIDFRSITEIYELWTVGTKLWKLADEHYGDGNLYWIIGLFNGRPTDAHWNIGDTVSIPFPYEIVAEALGF